jgi:hypothetical protein
MMDEAYLLEHIKEQLCFVSQDPPADLRLARARQSPHRWAQRGGVGGGGEAVQQAAVAASLLASLFVSELWFIRPN